MSAHARLATIAAAQAAMADLLRRVGHPDAPTTSAWHYTGAYQVRACVPIADQPVNCATEVVAELVAGFEPGRKAQVSATSQHWADVGDGTRACWPDGFRFQTQAGAGWMTPRTLAALVLEAMKP
jgi:hypothetical protein